MNLLLSLVSCYHLELCPKIYVLKWMFAFFLEYDDCKVGSNDFGERRGRGGRGGGRGRGGRGGRGGGPGREPRDYENGKLFLFFVSKYGRNMFHFLS